MKKRPVIIVYLSGGLGNQMFQYAFGRYLSLKYGVPLKLDLSLLQDQSLRPGFTLRQYDLDIFCIHADIAEQKDIPWIYRRYFSGRTMRIIEGVRRKILNNPGKEKHFQFDPAALSLGPSVYLEGYWQSEKYFQSIKDVIRSDFVLRDPISEKSQKLLEEIKNCNSVCIFVRRTDYVGNSFHDVVTKEYYEKALMLLQQKQSIDKLFIFSDDIEWCKDNMTFLLPTMFVDNTYAGEKYREKFELMSGCHHFIIPNSSFAWWAAWRGTSSQKIVIAPQQWFGDSKINTSDITPSEWIRI